mmetsp:Transcript_12446/g.30586  ORF Transcript_12446/g.30586 Transcript_12446/m.30586 type:complete len:156 (-) Transcript_12446:499-966(-)
MSVVQQRYPGVEVVGTQYPIAPWKQQAARVLGAAQMGAMGVILLGDKAFEFMGMATPPWYTANVAPNKMGWAMGMWFVGNMVHGALTQTNAFEIYANGQLVFSKLQQGRLPNLQELFSGLQRAGLQSWEEVLAEENALKGSARARHLPAADDDAF